LQYKEKPADSQKHDSPNNYYGSAPSFLTAEQTISSLSGD